MAPSWLETLNSSLSSDYHTKQALNRSVSFSIAHKLFTDDVMPWHILPQTKASDALFCSNMTGWLLSLSVEFS